MFTVYELTFDNEQKINIYQAEPYTTFEVSQFSFMYIPVKIEDERIFIDFGHQSYWMSIFDATEQADTIDNHKITNKELVKTGHNLKGFFEAKPHFNVCSKCGNTHATFIINDKGCFVKCGNSECGQISDAHTTTNKALEQWNTTNEE